MTTDIVVSIDEFMARWTGFQQENQNELYIEQDAQWPSPVEQGVANENGMIHWQPVLQPAENTLMALKDGLDLTPHPDAEAYFTRYFSDNLNAKNERGGLQLLMPWNQDDFIRLQQNLIAHLLMKRKLGQQETLFFAVTDEEDFVLSILNRTGEVVLEQVGKEPQEILANNLAEFLKQLQPDNF